MKRHSRNTGIILILIILVGIILGFKLVNKKVTPILMIAAKEESNKLATIVINDAIKKQVVDGLSFDKLFIITYENGEIATIDFDSVIVNKVLSTITSTIQANLKYIEQGNVELIETSDNVLAHYDKNKLKDGIIYEVPLGLIYNNPFISNLSPKIPVKIHLIGSIDSNIRTEVTNYGINNALIEVYVDVEVNLQVILPFISNETVTKTSVPLALKMVRGKIPEYYANGTNGPTLSVPINQ